MVTISTCTRESRRVMRNESKNDHAFRANGNESNPARVKCVRARLSVMSLDEASIRFLDPFQSAPSASQLLMLESGALVRTATAAWARAFNKRAKDGSNPSNGVGKTKTNDARSGAYAARAGSGAKPAQFVSVCVVLPQLRLSLWSGAHSSKGQLRWMKRHKRTQTHTNCKDDNPSRGGCLTPGVHLRACSLRKKQLILD